MADEEISFQHERISLFVASQGLGETRSLLLYTECHCELGLRSVFSVLPKRPFNLKIV